MAKNKQLAEETREEEPQVEGNTDAEDTEEEPERINRAVAAARALKEMGEEATVDGLAERADELFVEGGGKSNVSSQIGWVWAALETAEELGIVETVSVVKRVHGKK